MAENEPDMFGLSIVFKPGDKYQRDSEGLKVKDQFDDSLQTFVEMKQLTHVDFVDDPAANDDGLFSTFNAATIAGQVAKPRRYLTLRHLLKNLNRSIQWARMSRKHKTRKTQ
jgi:hypothetical protein